MKAWYFAWEIGEFTDDMWDVIPSPMEVVDDAAGYCVLELETLFTQTLYTPQPQVTAEYMYGCHV